MQNNYTIQELIEKVEKSSTGFETENTDLKRKYVLWNIEAFNAIASRVSVAKGSFGTGYPFYVLNTKLGGPIPIIGEQIRYNRELYKDGEKIGKPIHEIAWNCEGCLKRNYANMPDLKQICKPCPNMFDSFKPRKLINRLPDLDMWLVCQDGCVEQAQVEIERLLKKFSMQTSDVDPLRSIEDVAEITALLQKGIMPKISLPIDTHIMEYSKIKELIEQVPAELAEAKQTSTAPYLPIHPKSLRKQWQYDDVAYNFIYDFLSAFTSFNFPEELETALMDSRSEVAKTFTNEELFRFLIQAATPPNARRFQTPELKNYFNQKMDEWRKIKSKEDLQKPSFDPHDDGPNL